MPRPSKPLSSTIRAIAAKDPGIGKASIHSSRFLSFLTTTLRARRRPADGEILEIAGVQAEAHANLAAVVESELVERCAHRVRHPVVQVEHSEHGARFDQEAWAGCLDEPPSRFGRVGLLI